MTTFGTIVPDADEPEEEPTVFFVESADPVDLQNRVNAVLTSLDSQTQVITNITLAGAGDGHTFAVLIEVIDPSNTDGAISGGTQSGFPATLVRCYVGGSDEELVRARLAAGVPAPITVGLLSVPYALVDAQLAGGAKGQRFMGMEIYTISTIPPGLDLFPHVLGVGVTQALGAGQTILTFDNLLDETKFGFGTTQQEIEYQGDITAVLLLEASVSVTQNSASDFTVAIVGDPLGTAGVIASMQSHCEAGETDTVAVFGYSTGTNPLLAPTRFGLLVTGVAGTSESCQLRITAR